MTGSAETGRFEFKKKFKSILFISLIIGIVIRLFCTPLLSYDYDNYFWAIIVQNINSGNSLYEIEGFYYTPVWGYILGAYDILWSFLSPIGELGLRVPELFGIEELAYPYHSATVTNPLYLSGLKAILIACDILAGYLIYKETYDITKSRKRSEFAFALWFICPIVIYMSGVQCMFDGISALLVLSSLILMKKDLPILSGIMLALASLLKVFPTVCIPVFIAYLFTKNRAETKKAYTEISKFILALGTTAFALVLPNILKGDVTEILSFFTNRIPVKDLIIPIIIAVILVLTLITVLLIRRLKRTNLKVLEDKINLITLCALAIVVLLTITPAPQYTLVLLPLLIIHIASSDKGYMICWWFIGIAATYKALIMNNFSLLTMAAKYYGLVSYDWILSMMDILMIPVNWGTLQGALNTLGDIFVIAGLLLILLFSSKESFEKKHPKYVSKLESIKRFGKGREFDTDE